MSNTTSCYRTFLSLASCVLLFPSFGNEAHAELSDGLIATWQFDGADDDTEPLGEPTSVPGISGNAVHLNGSGQAVRIQNDARLKPAAQITISSWVRPEDLSDFRHIYRKEDGEQRQLLAFQENGNFLSFGLNVGGVYGELKAPVSGDISDGRWHLVTATYDGASMMIYLDGEQIGVRPVTGLMPTGGFADAFIGSVNGDSQNFVGAIDDVRLYERALTPAEVLALFKTGEQAAKEAGAKSPATGGTLIKRFAPPLLASTLRERLPIAVKIGTSSIRFSETPDGVIQGSLGEVHALVKYKYDAEMKALTYHVVLENKGTAAVAKVGISPLAIRMQVEPEKGLRARMRYLTGSFHYDATYPPRAFEMVEREFMTHDHAKPVRVTGGPGLSAHDTVPLVQFAVGQGDQLSGFMASFEWSSNWWMEGNWLTQNNFNGEKMPDFTFSGGIAQIDDLTLAPGQKIESPKVHMVFFEGADWAVLDRSQKKYISERVAGRVKNQPHMNKVTYDHWFGIFGKFDLADMKKQAKRAAELGSEFFCMDAGWYGKGSFGSSNTGTWDEPDPVKFPGGRKDVKELSDYVRSLGMGFGIWHCISIRNGGGEPFKYENEADVQATIATLRSWIKDWNVTWIRWELPGDGDFAYWQGYNKTIDVIRKEFPDLFIECCLSGGTRFDLAQVSRTQSTWLSDHTADPDVCRFMQTGALRFWPSHYLNMAVRVNRNSGDSEATLYNVVSRMAGAPSFNGDIAQWSAEATTNVRGWIDAYKSVRHLQGQPTFFPLPQPRNSRDWDVVVFGDGTGEGQLLYTYRMDAGANSVTLEIPGDADAAFEKVVGSEGAAVEKRDGKFHVTLPKNGAAIWRRGSKKS